MRKLREAAVEQKVPYEPTPITQQTLLNAQWALRLDSSGSKIMSSTDPALPPGHRSDCNCNFCIAIIRLRRENVHAITKRKNRGTSPASKGRSPFAAIATTSTAASYNGKHGQREEVSEILRETDSKSFSTRDVVRHEHEASTEVSVVEERKFHNSLPLGTFRTERHEHRVRVTDLFVHEVETLRVRTVETIFERKKVAFKILKTEVVQPLIRHGRTQPSAIRETLLAEHLSQMLTKGPSPPLGRLPIPFDATPEERRRIMAENDQVVELEREYRAWSRGCGDYVLFRNQLDERQAEGVSLESMADEGNPFAIYLRDFGDLENLEDMKGPVRQLFEQQLPLNFRCPETEHGFENIDFKRASGQDMEWTKSGKLAFHPDQFARTPSHQHLLEASYITTDVTPQTSAGQFSTASAFVRDHFNNGINLSTDDVSMVLQQTALGMVQAMQHLLGAPEFSRYRRTRDEAGDYNPATAQALVALDSSSAVQQFSESFAAMHRAMGLAQPYMSVYRFDRPGAYRITPPNKTIKDYLLAVDPSINKHPWWKTVVETSGYAHRTLEYDARKMNASQMARYLRPDIVDM
jgi:hypothetical protein